MRVRVHACVRACVCVRARVRERERACVRVCMCACVSMFDRVLFLLGLQRCSLSPGLLFPQACVVLSLRLLPMPLRYYNTKFEQALDII